LIPKSRSEDRQSSRKLLKELVVVRRDDKIGLKFNARETLYDQRVSIHVLKLWLPVPDDDHGDKRNIVMKQFVDAASAENGTVEAMMKNIDEAVADVSNGKLKSASYRPSRR